MQSIDIAITEKSSHIAQQFLRFLEHFKNSEYICGAHGNPRNQQRFQKGFHLFPFRILGCRSIKDAQKSVTG